MTISAACGRSTTSSKLAIGPLSQDEALQDFATLLIAYKGLYGPLEYKADHPVVKLDITTAQALAETSIKAANSDADVVAAFSKFIRSFRDGHAGINFPLSDRHLAQYKIPLFVMPVKDSSGSWQAVVVDVGDDLKDSGIKVGALIKSVDGEALFDLLPKIQQYKSYSNDISDRHLLYKIFARDFYMTDLLPTSPTALVEYQPEGSDGSAFENLVWKRSEDSTAWSDLIPGPGKSLTVTGAEDMNQVTGGSIKQMGNDRPFFATKEVLAAYDWTELEPTKQALKKFGIDDPSKAANIFAATYTYKGKKVFLLRQPGYNPPVASGGDEEAIYAAINVWIKTYKAIMWQNRDADVLVVDQTHNPGGASTFAADFFRLFIKTQIPNLVQLNNVDRKWVLGYWEEAQRLQKLDRPA